MKMAAGFLSAGLKACTLLALGAGALATPLQAELRAGAARVDVTPAPPAGFQAPNARYEHEHLYVRAIVIDNGRTRAVLIGADQSNTPDVVWNAASKQISDDLHCPIANILMSATHTHSSGVAQRPGGPGPPSPVLTAPQQAVVQAMVRAVHDAQGAMQPAQMAFGTGMAYLNVNRDAIQPETHLWTQAPNLVAPSDKTVAVLQFQTLTGVPIGVYVNYAMHPVNGYLADFTSADFAGAMSRYVEQSFGDKAIVVFTQGASGDQNPLYLRAATNGMASRSGVDISGKVLTRESVEGPLRDGPVAGKPMDATVRDRLERWMESEGAVLGEEVIRVMTDSHRVEREVRIQGAQTEITCPGRTRTDKGREGMSGTYSDGDPVPLRLGMLGIGDVALTSIDAEVYTLIAQKLKRESPMANTVVVTLANGAAPSGYVPDDASFSHNSFQVLGSKLKPGCAEDAIPRAIDALIVAYQTPATP